MQCPYCGSIFVGNPSHCPNCRQPLSRAANAERDTASAPVVQEAKVNVHTIPKAWLKPVIIVFFIIAAVFLTYKLYYQIYSWNIHRIYTRGSLTPTITQLTLSDGRPAHSIVYYGKDGDQIFVPELNRSWEISGGIARITIADANWFGENVNEIDYARIRLKPMLISTGGRRVQLPITTMDVDVPASPLEVIKPAENLSIVMSRSQLEIKVVPGSSVTLNGEDLTDVVNSGGVLTRNINVFPIGNNVYTIVVNTPKHRETRREITIYRPVFDISVEIEPTTATYSETETTTIKGTTEAGAQISVESSYIPESLIYDDVTGQFSFIARLSNFGDNSVRFRVSKDGRDDANVSLTIEYKPTPAIYASKAWAMDYMGLRRMYEQWHGQVFSCKGTVSDIFEENGQEYIVLDLKGEKNIGISETESPAKEDEVLVILANMSSVAKPDLGQRINALADVTGRQMYHNYYYPELAARYIYFLNK